MTTRAEPRSSTRACTRRSRAATPWTTSTRWSRWIYRDLFLMPPDDPALGLDVPDPV